VGDRVKGIRICRGYSWTHLELIGTTLILGTCAATRLTPVPQGLGSFEADIDPAEVVRLRIVDRAQCNLAPGIPTVAQFVLSRKSAFSYR
jgi:hypothetical protein